MPNEVPPSLYTQQVPGKGIGLFTSQAINAGELVFRIERPLLCVPDNRCLSEVCYHCFVWLPGGEAIVDDITTKLLVCMGCKVVRYCSKVGALYSKHLSRGGTLSDTPIYENTTSCSTLAWHLRTTITQRCNRFPFDRCLISVHLCNVYFLGTLIQITTECHITGANMEIFEKKAREICQSISWKTCHKYECKIYGHLYPRLLPSVVRMVMQLLLWRKASSRPEQDLQDFISLQAHIEDIKNDSIRNGKGSSRWQDVELMSQAALEYSQVTESPDVVQAMIARCLVNSMTVTSLGFDPLGTCVSTYASRMNHSCNPNCTVIFSGASLSIRSLQSVPAGGELTQSYVDRSMPTSRRKQSLSSVYYFDCVCDYCKSALTCGLPDLPNLLKSKLTLEEAAKLETEGMQLYSLSEKASPLERMGLLKQAMGLFHAVKDVYPLWRYPWPTIRHDIVLVQMDLENWYEALGHSLKGYFFIEPVLYPAPWEPLRTMRTFLLTKIMIEIEYNKSQAQNRGSAVEELDKFHINWPVAISGLMTEIHTAIPKGFGVDSSFAREFDQLRRGVSLEDHGWKDMWGQEREKLKNAAHEMVE